MSRSAGRVRHQLRAGAGPASSSWASASASRRRSWGRVMRLCLRAAAATFHDVTGAGAC